MAGFQNKSIAPAIALIIISPLIAEILPGATRFSSIFVFPIQVCVWGGGALLIRYIVRKKQLGWQGLLFLALALSIAEEFLIQQTSVAPMVIRLKGETYARIWGINYIYLLWALIYESISVVMLPVYLTELIFYRRRNDLWINKGGVLLFSILFVAGSFAAWYTWTKIARVKVFHLPAYHPAPYLIIIAVLMICLLFFAAFRSGSEKNKTRITMNLPKNFVFILLGAIWSIFLYGLLLLAFGISPAFPPLLAFCIGLFLAISGLYYLPRWIKNSAWNAMKSFSLIFGVLVGSMLVSFIGFIGSLPKDLYFKICVDAIAIFLLILFGYKIKKASVKEPAEKYANEFENKLSF